MLTSFRYFDNGETIKNHKNNYFFIWSSAKYGLDLLEYLIEKLPDNKILRFFKELYWDYLRIVYIRMIKRNE